MKKRILFLCTGNSARSQMAEGLARAFHSDAVDAVSAGSRPSGFVHPLAIRAMAEIGVDISSNESKSADKFTHQKFDAVVTVCDSAAQDCPSWPGAKRIEHWGIEDPSFMGRDPEARLRAFVETRNDLEKRIEELVKSL
ncbi:MAG TPA: arsenate reductase ArsC [Thermoanaerobaculia bacterium]